MQFWEDASPVVKGVVVVGSLLILYLGIGFFVGLPPWASGCADDCGTEATCVDGECVQTSRGI